MNERHVYGTKKFYPKLLQRSVREKNNFMQVRLCSFHKVPKVVVSIVSFVTFIGIPVAIESPSAS